MKRRAPASFATPKPGGAARTAALPAAITLLLSMIGAVLYAQQAAAEVLWRLIVEGGIVAGWLAAAAGWGVWLVRWLLKPARSSSQSSIIVGVTAAAIGLGIMSLAILGLGLAGFLSALTAWLLLGVGAALGLIWLIRSGKSSTIAAVQPATSPPGNGTSHRWHWLWLALVPALSLALVAAYVAPGLLWKPQEPHGYDVVGYHFQVPREWYEGGRIQPLEHNTFSYFPFAVEMHYLLAMHLRGGAWEGMYLAQLMHVAMVVLSVVAAYGIAGQLARCRSHAVIATVAGASVPWLAQLAPLGFNEGGLLLYGTLAIGWIAVQLSPTAAMPSDDQKVMPFSGVFALAGLCAGFACGVKLTAVPLLLLAVPAVSSLLLIRRSPRLALSSAVIFVAVGLIAFSPWLVRTFVWSGNPVFPEGRALFGNGVFSDVQAERWQKAHVAQPQQQSVAGRLGALADQVLGNWQFGWILLPLTIAALIVGWRSNVSRLLAGLLAIQLLFWLGFTHLQGRFFVLAIPIGILAIAAAGWRAPGRGSRHDQRSIILAGTVAAGVVISALVNWWPVHRRLAMKLYEEQGTGMSVALGNTDIAWITFEAIQGFPLDDPSARLLLVGDAKAFLYPLPTSRLRYRTVFDLDTSGKPLIDAFDPSGLRHDGKTWLLITPTELQRYENTYQPMAPIPEHWRRHPAWDAGVPILVPPAEVGRWSSSDAAK